MPSPAELLVVLGIVVLLFGAKKLPELARSMGKASREFKKGARDADEDEQPAAPRAEDTASS